MIATGIAGGSDIDETIGILSGLCRAAGLEVRVLSDDKTYVKGIPNLGIHRITGGEHANNAFFDILVVNDKINDLERCVARLEHGDMLLMNADNKDIYHILSLNKAILITYGFNGKASVTASSVMDGEVQICLQRGLPTFTGKTLEQQEFSVFYPRAANNVYALLAAITASVVTGLEIDRIRGAIVG